MHKEGFHNVYASSNIIKVIRSKTIYVEKVVRAGETRSAYKILVGKPEDLSADGKIILEWILRKQGGKLWTQDMNWWARVNTVMNLCVPYKAGNFSTR
jgi:hypothetical protein